MATETTTGIAESLARVFPIGSRINERGRLEIGGCDTIELAREFGTPAYVVAEDDLRARARAFVEAGRAAATRTCRVVFASKAFPCTAVMRLFAQEGLWCDVASGGELHLALQRRLRPRAARAARQRQVRGGAAHGAAPPRRADRDRQPRRGRCPGAAAGGSDPAHPTHPELADMPPQPVLVRVTPDVSGDTHEKISTGQADSKFGFAMDQVAERSSASGASAAWSWRAARAHRLAAVRARALPPRGRAARRAGGSAIPSGFSTGTSAAASASPTPMISSRRRSRSRSRALVEAAREQLGDGERLLIEPGRALGERRRDAVHRAERQAQRLDLGRVDGGMSDNLRPMLYGAPYEAHVADRLGGDPRACWPASTASRAM